MVEQTSYTYIHTYLIEINKNKVNKKKINQSTTFCPVNPHSFLAPPTSHVTTSLEPLALFDLIVTAIQYSSHPSSIITFIDS